MSQVTTIRKPASESMPRRRDTQDALYVIWLLPVHAAIWTIAAWLSRGNLDTQGDMIENYVWGIEWQAGYAKHPPLFAWITAAWFHVFPHVDIAYFALSEINAMAGLLGIVALAGRFVPRRLAAIAGLAMAVSPLYSNLAIKFNANAVLLSVWPWTAYFFIRFMQTGGWRSALAFGAFVGAAMLGKYFSVVLLLALAIAALARPAWRVRLLDRRALLAIFAGIAVLTPHIRWLIVNHFPTFGYAQERTGGTLSAAVARFGVYTFAQIAYLAFSFGFTNLLVRERRGQAARLMAASITRPSMHPDLWWLALGPFMVVGVIAVLSKTQMASVWGMAQWFAIVPLWLAVLARAGIAPTPQLATRVLAGYWVLVLATTAAVGYMGMLHNTDDATEPRAELAASANTLWRQRTGQEIPIVAGSVHEAESIAFYSDGPTRYWDIQAPGATPWLNAADLRRFGTMFVCRYDDSACASASAALSHAKPILITVSRHAWGMKSPDRQYELFLALPRP